MRLKELREARGMKQAQVAEYIGCTAVAYSRYETGAREPSIDMLLRLSDCFGVSVDYILGKETFEVNSLTAYEKDLIEASRRVDQRAREDALYLLSKRDRSPDSEK